ncbi:hypothetical protein [Paractinoplanes maris]|uniref:hypothetical protein n=1 Tax=Paractinoplanes maris TaxID=1734446 RepID=UPI0020205D39|nr:hypothetical protein [Actinoplanes maris]
MLGLAFQLLGVVPSAGHCPLRLGPGLSEYLLGLLLDLGGFVPGVTLDQSGCSASLGQNGLSLAADFFGV